MQQIFFKKHLYLESTFFLDFELKLCMSRSVWISHIHHITTLYYVELILANEQKIDKTVCWNVKVLLKTWNNTTYRIEIDRL